MRIYKEEIADLLLPHLAALLGGAPDAGELTRQDIVGSISFPQHADHGDFAYPCFPLAKRLRKPPPAIAKELASAVAASGVLAPGASFVKAEAASGYLNFFVDKVVFARRTLGAIAREGARYGSIERGQGRTVAIDFSSPNMGKELAFHHLRGTMIGNSLSRLYAKAGYKVVRINHLGDWGTSYGKLIVMFLEEGLGDADLPGMTIERLNALYKKFADAAAGDPSLEDRAREAFQRLEAGDPAYLKLWGAFKQVTLAELNRLYAILDVEFDSYDGEAYFVSHMPKVMGRLAEKGLVAPSQGAEIVDLSAHGMPPALLRKSDGATLYITRDLAAAMHRKEVYDFHRCLYVVDNGQSLHFQQLFKILELLGFAWHKDMAHIPFGLVLIKSEDGGWEKGKTRAGAASLLKDVIEAAKEKILGIIMEKNPEAQGKDSLAERIAVGALVFSELKNRRIGDIRFEWEQALSFEGDSGPYVQNAHVRLCSILRKSSERFGRSGPHRPAADAAAAGMEAFDFGRYPEPQAQALIQVLSRFSHRVESAIEADDPCPVAQYCLEIAEATHSFLHVCRALGSPEEKERLLLVDCARIVLGQALSLVGVPPIEEM
jgi:arginyl-tRNA synthetase